MRPHTIVRFLLLACGGAAMACTQSPSGDAAITSTQFAVDSALAAFVATIRAVDNHTHVNTTAPGDSESDALPLEALLPFSIPVRLRPDNRDWLAAYRALYDFPHADLNEAHLSELRGTMQKVAKEQGDRFPEWVLDRIGTETMLANRVAMGPGLAPPRFRWVSYADALMLPLSTTVEAAASPDRQKLYPLEEKLLRRYLADLHLEKLPATFDAYLKTVVTPTLERQRQAGCVAVKFEAAFLRSLDFDEVPAETASRVYARYVTGGEPSHAEYKALEDFLFRYIAREAGRVGMAVHLHSFEAPGAFYRAAGADPLLLESVFNDPMLRWSPFNQSDQEFARPWRAAQRQPDRTAVGLDGDLKAQESTALPLSIHGRQDRGQRVGRKPDANTIRDVLPVLGAGHEARQQASLSRCHGRRCQRADHGKIRHRLAILSARFRTSPSESPRLFTARATSLLNSSWNSRLVARSLARVRQHVRGARRAREEARAERPRPAVVVASDSAGSSRWRYQG